MKGLNDRHRLKFCKERWHEDSSSFRKTATPIYNRRKIAPNGLRLKLKLSFRDKKMYHYVLIIKLLLKSVNTHMLKFAADSIFLKKHTTKNQKSPQSNSSRKYYPSKRQYANRRYSSNRRIDVLHIYRLCRLFRIWNADIPRWTLVALVAGTGSRCTRCEPRL